MKATKTVVVGLLVAFMFGSPSRAVEISPLEKMVGQMIMVGFKGTSPSDPTVKSIAELVKQGRIGGVILFARNIRTPAQVAKLNTFLQSQATETKLHIAVDEEGGRVERLTRKKGFKHQPSAAWVASKSTERARHIYVEMARELAEAGFNINFGPVVDLNLNPRNPIIGKLGRSFSDDENHVIKYAREFIEAHRQFGLATCAKHFPGHGSASDDTHETEAEVDPINRLLETQVYLELADNNLLDSVMVAHIMTEAESRLPATLDPERFNVLRQMIGFTGVAFSDDMNMEAVRKRFSFEQGIVKAINAGNDVIVLGNVLRYNPDIARKTFSIIMKNIESGRINENRIREAYKRIVRLKQKYR